MLEVLIYSRQFLSARGTSTPLFRYFNTLYSISTTPPTILISQYPKLLGDLTKFILSRDKGAR
jgi:hypothetical protein